MLSAGLSTVWTEGIDEPVTGQSTLTGRGTMNTFVIKKNLIYLKKNIYIYYTWHQLTTCSEGKHFKLFEK